MQLVKTLALLITLSACATAALPPHPEEWICTVYPGDNEGMCFRAQKEMPEGPVFIKPQDMHGFVCRSPKDDSLHNVYVAKLEAMLRRGLRGLEGQTK